jgi:hypothetical protein
MGTGQTPTEALSSKRRANDKLRKKLLIGRLLEWKDNGKPADAIPKLRVPLIGCALVYKDHGITQAMYFSAHGEFIPDPESHKRMGLKVAEHLQIPSIREHANDADEFRIKLKD